MKISFISTALFAVALGLYGNLAWSGAEVGNGGDVIECPAGGNQPQFQFYDIYEGKTKYKMPFDLGEPTLSTDEKVLMNLKRIEIFDKKLASTLRGYYEDFIFDVEWVTGVELIDLPDVGSGYIPIGCKIRQLAVQITPEFGGLKRYTINKDIWDKLDNDSQASLIFHELLIREFSFPNTIRARYFHAAIASGYANTLMSYLGFLKVVSDYYWVRPDIRISTELSEIDFWSENALKTARAEKPNAYQDTFAWNYRGKTFPIYKIGFKINGEIDYINMCGSPGFCFVGGFLDQNGVTGYIPAHMSYTTPVTVLLNTKHDFIGPIYVITLRSNSSNWQVLESQPGYALFDEFGWLKRFDSEGAVVVNKGVTFNGVKEVIFGPNNTIVSINGVPQN